MKRKLCESLLVVTGMLLAGSAQAHDPSLHTNKPEEPKCEAMKEMDDSKMDKDDPVLQAIRKRCMADLHEQEDREEQHQNDDAGE